MLASSGTLSTVGGGKCGAIALGSVSALYTGVFARNEETKQSSGGVVRSALTQRPRESAEGLSPFADGLGVSPNCLDLLPHEWGTKGVDP